MIQQFQSFLIDAEASEMFITGVAGTGKTTSLSELIDYCIENKIVAVTCAYTHKAVNVLARKVKAHNEYNTICTLHSYLKKRPTINSNALEVKDVEGNSQSSQPAKVAVLFIDEFSMVGERDYVDIAALQYDNEGNLITKVVYIGDPNQLPPVKDMQVVVPHEPYWVKLTKIYRQADDNPLIDTLLSINDFINGAEVIPLEEHDSFTRGVDIVLAYQRHNKGSKVLLAYTNAQVESLNALVEGKAKAEVGDRLFSPTTREHYILEGIDHEVDAIVGIRYDILCLNSKFKTLETIHTLEGLQFFHVVDDRDNHTTRAIVFGHDTYLQYSQQLAREAVVINKKIETKFGMEAKDWANVNWKHEWAAERKEAWKRYLSFKDYVLCMDFAHAMTVHKSQGSTYDYVFLDIEDMYKCAKSNFNMYLRLMYVAISRASEKVYTN